MCSLTAASTTLWSVSTLGTLCHFCGQCLVPGQQGELVGRWEACALWGPGAGTQRFVKTVSWLFCTSPSTHSQPCSVPWGLTLQLPPWPPSPTASVDLKGGQSVSRAPWPLLQVGCSCPPMPVVPAGQPTPPARAALGPWAGSRKGSPWPSPQERTAPHCGQPLGALTSLANPGLCFCN